MARARDTRYARHDARWRAMRVCDMPRRVHAPARADMLPRAFMKSQTIRWRMFDARHAAVRQQERLRSSVSIFHLIFDYFID
jgi:hypothetical protein